MKMFHISAEAHYSPGANIVLENTANRFKVLFKDTAGQAHFYALECTPHGERQLATLLIYRAEDIRTYPSLRTQIAWSRQRDQAVLLINSKPQALMDFSVSSAGENMAQYLRGKTQNNLGKIFEKF